jgi:sugar-specific transcriptional regulator TrmB
MRMDFLVEKLRFLGLNDREVKVFTTLSTFGRMKMTKIASRSGLPRTTVDAIVRRLLEQGLVLQERIGNHFEYSVDLHKVADTLDWIEQRLRPRVVGEEKKETRIISDDNFVITEIETVEESFKDRAGDRARVLLARTPEDLDDALRRLSEYVGYATTTGTKLEILTCAQVADAVQKIGMENCSWEESNLIRLNVVPSAYCRWGDDTIVFPDRVLVRSIHTGSVESIHNKRVVETMKHLLEIANETGWSVDLLTWLNQDQQKV